MSKLESTPSEIDSPLSSEPQAQPLSPRFSTASLSKTERFAIGLMRRMTSKGLMRGLGIFWTRIFGRPIVSLLSQHRWKVTGAEHLVDIPKTSPLLIISNHRTFFDLFVIMTALRVLSKNRLGMRCVFPVRSPFFYDRPLGIFLNLLASGGAMYPPVFRDHRKETLNAEGLEVMRWLIRQRGVSLGFHPEGRRNQSAEPKSIAPLKRGVGLLLKDAHPDLIILPVFLEGLTNDFIRESLHVFNRGTPPPIHIAWGEPIMARDLQGEPEEIAERLHQHLNHLSHSTTHTSD